jgi:predicted acyltransferase
LPTAWRVLFRKLLMSNKTVTKKIQIMLIAGVTVLIIGHSLDYVTPIIKKIATSSFVFAHGKWTILALCLCYWLIDAKKLFTAESKMFIIVGINCIFIYLFLKLVVVGWRVKFSILSLSYFFMRW